MMSRPYRHPYTRPCAIPALRGGDLRRRPFPWIALLLGALTACGGGEPSPRAEEAASDATSPDPAVDTAWTPIFNGQDLSGWTPKIRYSEPGLDSLDTFRVEDGLLTVSYDGYTTFGNRFGHLFYDRPLSSYDLLVEYRFLGEQAEGGEDWARANSGVMIHAQPPESMPPDQDFPISLEAQFLAGLGEGERPTANLCTPGTEAEIDGTRLAAHCTPSTARTVPIGEWVTVELIVRGGDRIAHVMDGDTVLAYESPEIGGGVVNAFDPAAKPDGSPLSQGRIALQSESHPIQFRRVWLRERRSASR